MVSKSFNKSNNNKKLSKNEVDIMKRQITLIRNNIESFNKRFFLTKNQKQNKDVFRNKMINIEVTYTELKL